MLDEDMDAGENPDTVYTAKENIKADTTDPSQKAYLKFVISGSLECSAEP